MVRRLGVSFCWRERALVRADGFSDRITPDVLAWLHRDALIAATEHEIDGLKIAGAVPEADHAPRAAALGDQLLALERREEAVIARLARASD